MGVTAALRDLKKAPIPSRKVLRIKRNRLKTIKSNVSIHDRTQLETFFSYSLVDKDAPDTVKQLSYGVDAFLFFPPQLGIQPTSYPRERFYHDLKAFVRFREPKLSYKELMGSPKPDSQIVLPINYVRSVLSEPKPSKALAAGGAIEEVRMFGCSYVSYFWRRVERRRAKMKRFRSRIALTAGDELLTEEFAHFIAQSRKFCEKAYRVLREWRSLYLLSEQLNDPQSKSVKWEIHLVNEYCSYSLRDGLLELLREIDQVQWGLEYKPAVEELSRRIRSILRLERWYAKQASFFWIDSSSTSEDRENFIHRRSVLKKRISSILYLNPRPHILFRIRKQIGPMLAAGLAASWALAASIFIWTQSEFNGFKVVAALSGPSVFLVALAFVLSYVLKDRIKEYSRHWFSNGFFGKQPDLANKIFFDIGPNRSIVVGEVHELMHYQKPKKVPDDIRRLRGKYIDPYVALESIEETVIHYTKLIKLFPKELETLHTPPRAIHDITRLSVESYLPRLDDPLHKGLILTKQGEVLETLMPKVYHVDLILKYSPLQNAKKPGKVSYDYFRLVLDKHGLTRIQQINK